MGTIFTKIIKGEIPCEKIAESENEIAFLDILPCEKGHTLVVPKKEVAKFEQLTEEEASSLMRFMHKVATAISNTYEKVDYKILLNNGPNAGQEVPHVHFHIIPRPINQPFSFKNRQRYQDGEMQEVGRKIREQITS